MKTPEEKAAVRAAYYRQNKEDLLAYAERYRSEHKDRAREYAKAYREAHPDADKKRSADYYRNNKNKAAFKEQQLAYNTGKGWASVMCGQTRSRAKRRGIEFSLTTADFDRMWAEQSGKCFWYGVDLLKASKAWSPQKPSPDRLDPEKGYSPENVVLASMAANFGRSNTSATEFAEFVRVLGRALSSTESMGLKRGQ